MNRGPVGRQYAAILLFAAAYLCVGWFVHNSYYQLDHDAGADLGHARPFLEHPERL